MLKNKIRKIWYILVWFFAMQSLSDFVIYATDIQSSEIGPGISSSTPSDSIDESQVISTEDVLIDEENSYNSVLIVPQGSFADDTKKDYILYCGIYNYSYQEVPRAEVIFTLPYDTDGWKSIFDSKVSFYGERYERAIAHDIADDSKSVSISLDGMPARSSYILEVHISNIYDDSLIDKLGDIKDIHVALKLASLDGNQADETSGTVTMRYMPINADELSEDKTVTIRHISEGTKGYDIPSETVLISSSNDALMMNVPTTNYVIEHRQYIDYEKMAIRIAILAIAIIAIICFIKISIRTKRESRYRFDRQE